MNVRLRWCRPQKYYDLSKWRGTYSHDGGALTNQGIHHLDLLSRILNHHRFMDSDQADVIRSEVAGQLLQQASALTVARLNSWINWVRSSDDLSQEQWLQLAEVLRQRWQAEEEHNIRRQLGDQLTSIYATHKVDSEYLPFLRIRIQRERGADQPAFTASAVQRLFAALIGRPWTTEAEGEALSLLADLSSDDSSTIRVATQIDHLHRFVDAMLQLREAAARNVLLAEDHPEELTRAQLAERHAVIRKEAIEGVIASLEGVGAKLPKCVTTQRRESGLAVGGSG